MQQAKAVKAPLQTLLCVAKSRVGSISSGNPSNAARLPTLLAANKT